MKNSKPATGPVTLLIGTRQGAFLLRGDKARRRWKLSGPILLGNNVHHLVQDPRERRSLIMAAKTG
ncbi:MAG: glycosyl hydrolase, partial [Acidobacteria bacterium]|nr:glycosyl hydrolase [Acidobacteriota bacterium]